MRTELGGRTRHTVVALSICLILEGSGRGDDPGTPSPASPLNPPAASALSPPDDSADPIKLADIAENYRAVGDYAEAANVEAKRFELLSRNAPAPAEDRIDSASRLGRDYVSLRQWNKSAEWVGEALRLANERHAAHPDLLTHLKVLELKIELNAAFYFQGRTAEAKASTAEILEMLRTLPDSPPAAEQELVRARALYLLGVIAQTEGDMERAASFLAQAKTVADPHRNPPGGRNPIGRDVYVETLNLLASTLSKLGKQDESLAIRRELIDHLQPAAHSSRAIDRLALGDAYLKAGAGYRSARKYHQAIDPLRNAIAILETMPFDDSGTADKWVTSVVHLVACLEATEGPIAARELMESAKLFASQKSTGGNSVPTEIARSTLHMFSGMLWLDHANLARARREFETSLQLHENALGKELKALKPADAENRAAMYSQLTNVYCLSGQAYLARDSAMKSLELLSAAYPETSFPHGHVRVVIGLSNAALSCSLCGDLAQAFELGSRSTNMLRRLAKRRSEVPSHIQSVALQQYAEVLIVMGRMNEAKSLLEEAVLYAKRSDEIRERSSLDQVVASVCRLSKVHVFAGDSESAVELAKNAYDRAQQLQESSEQGDVNQHIKLAASHLSFALNAAGRHGEAWDVLRDAMLTSLPRIETNVWSMSEAESVRYVTKNASLPASLFTAWKGSLQSDSSLYELIWLHRGAIQRLTSLRASLARSSSNPQVRELLARRKGIVSQLALRINQVVKRDEMMSELIDEKDHIDRELAMLVNAGDEVAADTSGYRSLIDALPAKSAFVDIAVVSEEVVRRDEVRGRYVGSQKRYVAFVCTRDKDLAFLDLGVKDEIDELVGAFRRAVIEGEEAVISQRLREEVWDPIEAKLGSDVERVWIRPDGEMSLLPWACIPKKDGTGVILEQYVLSVVASGQFLRCGLVPDEELKKPQKMLVVGDVDFNASARSRGDRFPIRVTAAVRGDAITNNWPILPGTRQELDFVLRRAAKVPAVVVTGEDATSARVRKELTEARWAHIATHGMFYPPVVPVAVRNQMGFRGSAQVLDTEMAVQSPLLFTGLVFAGANRSETVEWGEESFLTGEEITMLPLDGLELVVLSACNSGVGSVAAGEGVFGLQRAFHTAGAKNIVCSLWRVDDSATAILMDRFYTHLLEENMAPAEALREAQLFVYRNPGVLRTNGTSRGVNFRKTEAQETGNAAKQQNSPASLWGAFVLSGAGVLSSTR